MKAILFDKPGPPENLYVGQWPEPSLGAEEVLIRVHATALNRADCLQRKGGYNPPPGASPLLGLEAAGEVIALGEKVSRWKIGDSVMGLLSGGGYAEFVAVHASLLMPVPHAQQADAFIQAAAIPEVFLTAWQALSWLGKLQNGERVLIHAGASGVGTSAIQIAKILGAEVIATASASKHKTCHDLGADLVIDYKSEDFAEVVLEHTNGQGVDVILDFVGASYFQQNLRAIATDGRWVMISFLGGIKVPEVNLLPFLRKRVTLTGTTLRARNLDYKARLIADFQAFAMDKFENGQLKAVIDSVVPWENVADAHKRMEANLNVGKIVLATELAG